MATRLALCVLTALLAMTAVARADGPVLTVTNLGQPSAPVEVGQPPIEIAATNSCAHPFTLANESACAPGTWPPLGKPWGAIEDVAGGDVLRLEFGGAVSAVSVGSTSNYEPGLTDPDGKSIANYDVLAESPATATSDPAVWLVTLPALDARAISTQGYTFSVVAQTEAGFRGYPFGIRSPRYANELTKCGRAFYSTGWEQNQCAGKDLPNGRPLPFRVSAATYDGRILKLDLKLPAAGTLSLAIPTVCRRGEPSECHRKTSLVRRSVGPGHLIVRKRLRPRLGAARRLNLSARLEMSEGTIASALKPKVHFVDRAG